MSSINILFHTEPREDDGYEDIMPLTRLELCLKGTMDARAHFTPGCFGSFHFHRVELDHEVLL